MPPPARIALALSLAAAACSVVGDGETLSDAQQVIAEMKIGPPGQKAGDLTITGSVDHEDRRYRVGEPITLSVEVSKEAYVAVLRVMPSGATTLIFPSKLHPAAQVAAHSVLRIPDPASIGAVAADRPGVVLLEIIAASRGGSFLFSPKPAGSADFAELGTTTRALAKDIVGSLRGGETAASHLTLVVTAR
jgi:Domain of unknown function (DUF4384)